MEICADSFFINIIASLVCTLKIKPDYELVVNETTGEIERIPRTSVQAHYGPVPYTKTFLYTPGTGVDPTHANYGFRVEYSPAPGESNFPPGVTLEGRFEKPPDLSAPLTEPREGVFNGVVTIDRDQYPGSSDPRFVDTTRATIIFNPGV